MVSHPILARRILLLAVVLGSMSASPAHATFHNSGTVTSADFGLLRARLGTVPGPSGLHP